MDTHRQSAFESISPYRLHIEGLNDPLYVATFSTQRCALGRPAVWHAAFQLDEPLPSGTLLDNIATLSIDDDSNTQLFKGIIRHVNIEPAAHQGFTCEVHIASPSIHLTGMQHYRTFINKSLQDIVSDVLEPLSKTTTIEWKLKQPMPRIPYRMQSGENDLIFLQRLLFEHGITFIEIPTKAETQFLLCDELAELKAAPLVLDYSPLIGSERLQQSIWEIFANHTLTAEGAATHYVAKTDATNLQVGKLISLSGHSEKTYNQSYRIIEMECSGKNTAQQGSAIEAHKSELPFINTITLVKVTDPLRLPELPIQSQLHTLPAMVESTLNGAMLDENGYYRIRFLCDEHKYPKGEASPPIPMVHPYGGQGTGYHHPHQDGATVAVGFLDDDINQPIIVGAMPSINAQSPVTEANNTQHIFRSNSGHEIRFDDHPDNSHISLTSSEQKNQFTMHDQGEESLIKLASQGDINFAAKQDISQHITGDHTIEANNHVVTVKDLHSILTQQGDIKLQSGKDFNTNSKNITHLESTNDSTSINVAKDSNITAQQSIHMQSQQGDVTMQSQQDTTMVANQKMLIHNQDPSKPVTLQGGSASLQLLNGNNVITAKNITLSADTINFMGNVVGKNSAAGAASDQGSSVQQFAEKVGLGLLDIYADEVEAVAGLVPGDGGGEAPSSGDSSGDANSRVDASKNMYPSLSFSLDVIPRVKGTIVFDDKEYFYTANLSGEIMAQKSGTYSPINFSLDDYKLTARDTVGQFFSDLSISPKDHEVFMLGSQNVGEYLSDSVEMARPFIIFKASPKPIDKTYQHWKITGDLGFTLILTENEAAPISQAALNTNMWSLKQWHEIELAALVAGTALIGEKLAISISRVALAALVA